MTDTHKSAVSGKFANRPSGSVESWFPRRSRRSMFVWLSKDPGGTLVRKLLPITLLDDDTFHRRVELMSMCIQSEHIEI